MTRRRPDPQQHTRTPRDHRYLRGRPFLAGTIPQPDDATRYHDAEIDRLVTLVWTRQTTSPTGRAA